MFCLSVRPAPETPDFASMMTPSALDQLALGERQQREKHGRGVAARTGDEPRGLDLFRVMLGQAVDRALQKMRRAMLAAVPFGVDGRIAQAKVRRHVDHLHPLGELGDLAMGCGMRQPAKRHVDLAPIHLVGGDERRQVEGRKMREDLRERLAGVALGDQRGD